MATITGLTAERMLEIEAASIIDGDVVGDNLILTKHDGTEINAGDVRGPVGPPGVTALLGAILKKTGAPQSIPSGGADITGFTTAWDSGGVVSGDTIVIPETGLWRLSGGICWGNSPSTTLVVASIQVNGLNKGIGHSASNNTGQAGTGGTFSGEEQLVAGDVVKLYSYQASGANISVVTNGFILPRLSAVFLG